MPFLFHIPSEASGECLRAAGVYEKGLQLSGQRYQAITVNGYKGPLDYADPTTARAVRGRRKYIIHRLTRVGDSYVDWTARQLDSRLPYPSVMGLKELRALWRWNGSRVVGLRKRPL